MEASEVLKKADEAGVRFIRMQFTDILGILKDVAIPVERLPEAFDRGIRFDGSALQGFVRTAESDMLLCPDPQTFALFPWSEPRTPTGRLICSVAHMDGTPFGGCPRWNLRRVLENAAGQGYAFECWSEIEFYLLKPHPSKGFILDGDDTAGYLDHSPQDGGDDIRRILVVALREMGIPVVLSHHENSPGQHELVIGVDNALRVADHIITVRAAARRVAAPSGYHATFMPKPQTGVNGSGLHLHIGILKGGRISSGARRDSGGPGRAARAFTAGLLEHAPALCAVANPLINSYKRLVPGFEAPVRINWSRSGRGPLVRVPESRDIEACVEYRGPDPSCNPYLLLAAALQSGLDGLLRELVPFPEEEDAESGQCVRLPLPRTLGEALAALEGDSGVRSALGGEILPDYLEAKRIEWEMYLSQVDRWEIRHYMGKY